MGLKDKYKNQVVAELMSEMGIKNIYSVPRPQKVVLNMGLGEALKDKGLIDTMLNDLYLISGQKPVPAKSKYDISGFNRLKKGDLIGVFVTLRKNVMWNFLDKLVSIVLPGVKDFKGLSRKSFDGHGNLNIGIKNHLVFHEVDQNRIDKPRGLQITIVCNSGNDDLSYLLLKKLGFPFRD